MMFLIFCNFSLELEYEKKDVINFYKDIKDIRTEYYSGNST